MDRPRQQLRVVKTSYPAGFESTAHDHHDAQLIYPSSGVMQLETQAGHWIVPPMRACWLPAGLIHTVKCRSPLAMHSVYCSEASMQDQMPQRGAMLPVSALMRESILWLDANQNAPELTNQALSVQTVLQDQLLLAQQQKQQPFALPSLANTVLADIETALQADPANTVGLTQWAEALGVSDKTLGRRFQSIAGMPFTAYRTQVRLFCAIEMLASGAAVTTAAYSLGFASASAFITHFKAATGTTPGKYFSNRT